MRREQTNDGRDTSPKVMLVQARQRLDAEQRDIDKQRKGLGKLTGERRKRLERALQVAQECLAERKRSLGEVVKAVVE